MNKLTPILLLAILIAFSANGGNYNLGSQAPIEIQRSIPRSFDDPTQECVASVEVISEDEFGNRVWLAQFCDVMDLSDVFNGQRPATVQETIWINQLRDNAELIKERSWNFWTWFRYAEGLMTNQGLNHTSNLIFNGNFTSDCAGQACNDDEYNIIVGGNISRSVAATDVASDVNDCASQASPNVCEVVSCGGARAEATFHRPTFASGTGVIRLERTFNITCDLGQVSAALVFSKSSASNVGDTLGWHAILSTNATLNNGDTFILRGDITMTG